MEKYIEAIEDINSLIEDYGFIDEEEIENIISQNNIDLSVSEFFTEIQNKLKNGANK